MTQVFDDGWDEKVVHKDISGPTADGYFEVGGRVYYQEPLIPTQEKAWEDHVNAVIKLGRSLR